MIHKETGDDRASRCPVVVLAGGLGTRLRSAYDEGPKCMAPVGGRPFLEYVLRWLRHEGIQHVVLCIGYKGEQVKDWLGNGTGWDLTVEYSEEPVPLGTGGALKLAESMIDANEFFVANGDTLLEVSLARMYSQHRITAARATLSLVACNDPARYGTVVLSNGNRIIAFGEKRNSVPRPPDVNKEFINGGFYLFKKEFLSAIPSSRPSSLEREILPHLLAHGTYGFVTAGYFIDIGVPQDFARAQIELPSRVLE